MMEICECCRKHVDDCICAECEVCGSTGDPKCYAKGKHRQCKKRTKLPPLKFTREQVQGQIEFRQAIIDEIMNDDTNFLWELSITDKESDYYIDDEMFEATVNHLLARYDKWLKTTV